MMINQNQACALSKCTKTRIWSVQRLEKSWNEKRGKFLWKFLRSYLRAHKQLAVTEMFAPDLHFSCAELFLRVFCLFVCCCCHANREQMFDVYGFRVEKLVPNGLFV